MKRLISLLLVCGLLCSLSGCRVADLIVDMFNKSPDQPEFEPVDTMQTDFDTNGIILDDVVPCYSSREDMTQIKTLNKGDRVHIYYREYGKTGEDWVFTDCGWIYGAYVRTVEDSEMFTTATIAADALAVFADSSINSAVQGLLTLGDQVELLAIGVCESNTWARISNGYVPLFGLQINGAPRPGSFIGRLEMRMIQFSEPGLEYAELEFLDPGEYILVSLAEADGTLWAETEFGAWICMDALVFDMPIRWFLSDGSYFQPDPQRFATEQPDSDPQVQPTTPPQPTNPGGNVSGGNNTGSNPGDQFVQTPHDSPLIGQWVKFDPDRFMQMCEVSPETWTFRSDGSCSNGSSEIMYFPDLGGWYGASGGWGSEGIFRYDGENLDVQSTFYDADPSIPPETSTSWMRVTINGDTAMFGGNMYCRTDGDVNTLIRDCVRRNAAANVFSDLPDTWIGDNGTTWVFNSDGTFTESGVNTGHGYYMYCNLNLILVYEVRNGAATNYIGNVYMVYGTTNLQCTFSGGYGPSSSASFHRKPVTD